MSEPIRTVCLAHRKDADGIISASIVKIATGAKVILVDYNDIVSKLRQLDDRIGELYICDVGTNDQIFNDLLGEVRRLSKRVYVEYIDHHPIRPTFKAMLKRVGVHLNHTTRECSGMLTYLRFQERLPRRAALMAAYAAVTEYLDDTPRARAIVDGYDRQFVLFEATLLSYAISRKSGDQRYLERLVERLSTSDYPHRILGAVEYAVDHVEKTAVLLDSVERDGRKMRNLAYLKSRAGTGNAANFLRGAFDVSVGVAFKVKREEGVVEISLRGSESCRQDLGRIVSDLAGRMGGSGGGHPKASGARIPENRIGEFLKKLDRALGA